MISAAQSAGGVGTRGGAAIVRPGACWVASTRSWRRALSPHGGAMGGPLALASASAGGLTDRWEALARAWGFGGIGGRRLSPHRGQGHGQARRAWAWYHGQGFSPAMVAGRLGSMGKLRTVRNLVSARPWWRGGHREKSPDVRAFRFNAAIPMKGRGPWNLPCTIKSRN
jgi:hypothetical protein